MTGIPGYRTALGDCEARSLLLYLRGVTHLLLLLLLLLLLVLLLAGTHFDMLRIDFFLISLC